MPAYETAGAAGHGSARRGGGTDAPIILAPGARAAIPTGLAIALPPDFEAQVRPRSGLALRDGIGQVNAPGTIDADYRGEIHVILINHGAAPFTVRRGSRHRPDGRIARAVIQATWAEGGEPG